MQEQCRKTGDLWSGVALALLGVYIVIEARGWDYLTAEGPGAGFFPLWYGIAILALALVLVCGAWRSRGGAGVPREARRPLALLAALGVTVAAFKFLGFVVSFALLTFFIVAVMYRRPRTVAALTAVCTAAALHLVFSVALGVRLPTGIPGF
jgi:putative tricarboxylic transport membrane protein